MKWVLFLGLLFIFPACGESPASGENLNPLAFSEKIENTKDAVLLDVRTPEEWEDGIIKGARLLNIYDEEFRQKLAEYPKETTLLFYCRSGGRSSGAVKISRELGFSHVYHLQGGITKWRAEGYATTVPDK